MSDLIITFNAGSATLKFALYTIVKDCDPELIAAGNIDHLNASPQLVIRDASSAEILLRTLSDQLDYRARLQQILDWVAEMGHGERLVAAGHRVVHGGREFASPVIVDDQVRHRLEPLSHLAPLHQPYNLAAIDAFAEAAPGLPQVACFDTAFHRSNPSVATQFALPRDLTNEGVRRYGFHGLSYHYIASVLPQYAGALSRGRVIVAHLGAGASLCALYKGQSIATTMGFTALDGLPMAERCGNLDPGVVLYLMREQGMDYEELTRLLYHQSGLLGVSGISGDMRVLEEDGSTAAREAINLFVYRIGREIGSLAAALGGLDLLVFTGGIGEHSASVRAAVCENARWLGVELDSEANDREEAPISTDTSRVAVFRIPTDENRVIAQATQALL